MKADKKQMEQLIKTAKGQLDGILKMMEENRYCIDISNQLMATQAILTKVNREVLKAHLQGCVAEANNSEDKSAKIEEMMKIMDKIVK